MVPPAVSITTLHCPEAQRWNEVDIQFHSPSELEQSEPTAISPPAANIAAVEAPAMVGRRMIAHIVELIAVCRLRVEDEWRTGAGSAPTSTGAIMLGDLRCWVNSLCDTSGCRELCPELWLVERSYQRPSERYQSYRLTTVLIGIENQRYLGITQRRRHQKGSEVLLLSSDIPGKGYPPT